MDKIQKFLRSLSKKEREAIELLLVQLMRDPLRVPGIISLKGKKGWYRVRMGFYRIVVFIDPKTKNVEIRRITRRNEKTYKDL